MYENVGAACGRIHPTGMGKLTLLATSNVCFALVQKGLLSHIGTLLPAQVQWCGIRSLSMPWDIGYRRRPSMCLALCSAAQAVSVCFVVQP